MGDVDYTTASKVASKITPVPGGVGPMTIAMLLTNTLNLYKYHLGQSPQALTRNTSTNKLSQLDQLGSPDSPSNRPTDAAATDAAATDAAATASRLLVQHQIQHPVPSDIAISQSVEPLPIADIAKSAGILSSECLPYGDNKAKVNISKYCLLLFVSLFLLHCFCFFVQL